MGARKLPAAPALEGELLVGCTLWLESTCVVVDVDVYMDGEGGWSGMSCLHAKVYAAELFDACCDGFFERVHAADVDGTNTNDFTAGAGGSYVFGHAFGLFDVAADDTGICT